MTGFCFWTHTISLSTNICIQANNKCFLFQLATWLDETLSAVAYKLEHPAQTFQELKNQQVTSLYACDLYSCVQVENGAILWW